MPHIRDTFFESVIDEIDLYFPQRNVKKFAIFQPRNMPKRLDDVSTYGTDKVAWICNYFKWGECEDLGNEWSNLLGSILDSDTDCTLRQRHTQPQLIGPSY